MWNLKTKYKWTYLLNRKRPTDTENKLVIMKGKGGGEGINYEVGMNTYTLLYVNQKNNKDLCTAQNYIQYLVITYKGKESEKYTYNWITMIYIWNNVNQPHVCCSMSDSLQPHGCESQLRQTTTRLLCPRDSLGKYTGVGCHALLQGIFPTQGLNPGLRHCRQTV